MQKMISNIQNPSEAKRGGARVLVVDDDRDIVSGLSVRLRAAGYQVYSAHDGASGYDAALETHPDAMIVDVRMPCMDGLSMLAKLRERPETRATPVIVLSASLRDHQTALDMGARYFLDKPCDPRTLLTALHTVTPASVRE
jgi:DNA-binding response OmpR family regulator